MYHYVKNGKPFQSETPLYYFKWVYGNSYIEFGMHGTEAEYKKSCEKDDRKDRKLIKKDKLEEGFTS